MKTSNLTIVFTDIKGFTERTSRQTHEENERLLRTHHQLLAPVFKAFGGRIIKSIGDAFLVTFESPTQAVLSGMAIQDRLWQYNRSAPEAEQIHVRVAINVGEVRLEAGDVFGEPVNIAARVESLADGGEVFFTEAVYLAMNKAEVPSEEVGSFELKGIPGKIRVFRVPRAPYRVAAPHSAEASTPAEAPAGEQPPFGNLALSRVPASALPPPSAANAEPLMADLGRRVTSAGQELVQRASTALSGSMPAAQARRLSPRHLAMGAGALAVVLGAALVLVPDRAERAISAVEDASPQERKAAVQEARKLIAEEKDPARRSLLEGRLAEASGSPLRAVAEYQQATKAGSSRAARQLIRLLEHPECRVRSEAAESLGELRLDSARGALEELAEEGGPGEEEGLPFFGCSSKKAAQNALQRLGR